MIISNSVFTLLRRVPPESAIGAWIGMVSGRNLSFLYRSPDPVNFKNAMRNDFRQYSPDEVANIYDYTFQNSHAEASGQTAGVFSLLADSVEDMLTFDSWRECRCRFHQLVDFRELTHPIGQELFVAAYLARKDLHDSFQREIFSFPPVVRTDNIRLYQVLDRGMAENHFHIGGSVSAFLYSWLCLMNHIGDRRREEFQEAGLDQSPLDQSSPGVPGRVESSYSLVFKAACIRYFLFLRLHDSYPVSIDDSDQAENSRQETVSRSHRWMVDRLLAPMDEDEVLLYALDLDQRLESCRLHYCPEAMEGEFVPDYAMEDEPFPPEDDDDRRTSPDYAVHNYERRIYRSLSGEQKFQYRLFRAIFEGDPKIQPYADLVYAYLLIYTKFRSELVQVNRTVGFANFAQYQDRKDIFSWHYPNYTALRERVAQQSVLLNPQVRSLEGRMIPKDCYLELKEKLVKEYRYAVQADSQSSPEYREHVWSRTEEKLHYVLHFAKRKQPFVSREQGGEYRESVYPRDDKLRQDAERRADAILTGRRINPQVPGENGHRIIPFARVTGIDACANEIGCRPEVFAPSFRRMRYVKIDMAERMNPTAPELLPALKITYHAGEDFLDLIDGLRAVDEAVRFLELDNGDRLGHAIALGIDPENWYSAKNYSVILPKQDLLDNMAWLLNQMRLYQIYERDVEDFARTEFRRCFDDIFLKTTDVRDLLYSATVEEYFESMRLRGNDPMLYRDLFGVKYGNTESRPADYQDFVKQFEEAVNLDPWRVWRGSSDYRSVMAVRLYHLYHFCPSVKWAGEVQTEYHIPYAIVNVVRNIQKRMQQEAAALNIGIESNPSSNYLISTFRDYGNHPIFAFNDAGLYDKPDNPRLQVSINTDDLGVFDTTLENEYALMASALERKNQLVSTEQQVSTEKIYNWLDHVREMGCNQSFRHLSP